MKKRLDKEFLSELVGIPWKEDGRSVQGTDCTGLMQLYFNGVGIQGEAPKISENRHRQPDEILNEIREKNIIVGINEIQPEDVLVFFIKDELHVGLYLGYGRMLHAMSTGNQKSRISKLDVRWSRYFVFGIREKDGRIYIPPAGDPVTIIVASVAIGATVGGITGGWKGALFGALGGLIGGHFGILYGLGGAFIGASLGSAMQAKQQNVSVASPRYKFGELQTTSTNQTVVPRVYGEVRLGGNIIYQNPVSGGEEIDVIVAFAEGEIESFSDIRLNGELYTAFPGVTAQAFTGTSSQNVELSTGLDLDGVQYRHLACIHFHLVTSEKLKGGRPNFTAVIKGQKVSTWNGSVWSASKSWSANPAACIRDYLISPIQVGGAGYSGNDLDDTAFGEVYDYCDALVDDGSAGTEARYVMGYAIDQRRSAIDNLSDMLIGIAGNLVMSGSRIKMIVDRALSAVMSLDADDVTELKVFQKGYEDKINRFGVEYFDPDQNDTRILAWGAEDKADQDARGVVDKTVTIPSINRYTQASRLSNQFFYELKLNPLGIEFKASLAVIGLEVGDVFNLTHALMNWTDKPFRCVKIEESELDEYLVTAQEYNATIYNDRFGAGIEVFNYGTPPNPYVPVTEVSSLSLSESVIYIDKDGTVTSDLIVSFSSPTDTTRHFLSHYQIELKKGSENFVTVATTTDASTRIFGVEAEVDYQVRVRTVSINGIISDGVTSSVVTTLGKAAPPSNVTGFDANQLGGQIHFTWNAAPDVDLARYIIKKGSEWSSGDVIAELVDLTEFDYPVGEIGTVVYMIKAIDTSGNESANPAIDVIIQTTPPEMNFVNDFDPWSVSQEYLLSGVGLEYRNLFNSGFNRPVLSLATQKTWEELEAEGKTWEQAETDDDLILDSNFESSGYFEMIDPLDLEAIFEFKIVADLLYENVTGGSLTLQISTSEDGITYSGFADVNSATLYRARFVKFKFILATSDANQNIYFYGGTVFVNAPVTRVDYGRDVAIPGSGVTIVFGQPFTSAPKVTANIVNGIVGFIEINSKTQTGFFTRVWQDQAKTTPLSTSEIDWDARGS